MMKKDYYQKVALLGMLLIILFGFQKYTGKKENFSGVQFISENAPPLSDFDPNELDAQQWQSLGFSEKQAATILHYKELIGGKFISKAQLKKCYAIKAEKFEELNPYLMLPETTQEARVYKNQKQSLILSGKFNPDHISADRWIQMGFSEKQAEAILKYKKYLGGSFGSKEKLKECFIISEEHYRQLEPYLILPDKISGNSGPSNPYTVKTNIQYKSFDPNILDIAGWQSLGFTQNQAKVIVNYRDKNLKGNFKSPEDLKKCFVISAEKFEELEPYIKIDPTAFAVKQEKTDFSKTDLNAITFKQLLEFGLDEKSAGSMIGFRRKLGGFVNKQQILETYNIDKEQVEKLISICPLNATEVQKYTLLDAPEEWLKNHPYFKYSANKIIFYRISTPDEKKIWKLLKLKPEYETRMKLYLK
ncbi:helix-hairpin-helix domain-containing protein [Chryseobacterium defluvii]|nr:helix-hairpin-helix domain-containing protein [Chryseobacterium defluvii]